MRIRMSVVRVGIVFSVSVLRCESFLAASPTGKGTAAIAQRAFSVPFSFSSARSASTSSSPSTSTPSTPTNRNGDGNTNTHASSVKETSIRINDTTTTTTTNTVVVKRNRQSMEFRKGSQLVFQGAIDHTIGSSSTPPKMAELVKIVVPLQQQQQQQQHDDGSFTNSGGGKKQQNNSKRKKNTNNSNKSVEYKHFMINTNDDQQQQQQQQDIGWGVYNPFSLYRVRILCHANLNPELHKMLSRHTTPDDAKMPLILKTKLQAAIQTRNILGLGVPTATTATATTTDSYRLVNGEGDGLSGLAMDVLGGSVVVCMSSAAWCQVYQQDIIHVIQECMPDMTVVWKTTPSRLKQDGWNNRNPHHDEEKNLYIDDDDENEDQDETNTVVQNEDTDNKDNNNDDTVVVVRENGILYQTFPFRTYGQKTGFYCDQRDNRLALTRYTSNKRVLDLCCYHGGFSLAAYLLGGATNCTGVDSSQDAIDTCRENAKLNGIVINDNHDTALEATPLRFVCDDISNFMKQALEEGHEWDVIVLDPPKLAPSVSGLDRATRKYHSLNRDAIKLLSNQREGGLLLTCTCSAAMTQSPQTFLQMVQQAGMSAGRHVTLLHTSGAAPCHVQSPASYPAGAYLTAALFHVHPK